MSKQYREVSKLLALADESFEDEVRRLGISTQHLTLLQVLTAIQHAELRMNYTFTETDFLEGKVGLMMKPEDFDFEVNRAKLLAERKSSLEKDLATMLGALKVQFEKAKKEYEDLPADTPIVDLHHMADIDAKKLPKMEESGDRCIRNIQEWMLRECSSGECAVLPEDKLQRILVGACNQLEIACHVERTALQLREDAVRVMKTALAGTATTKLIDVLEAAFGVEENEEDIPELDETEVEPEEENLPQEALSTKKAEDDSNTAGPSSSTSTTTSKRLADSDINPKGGKSKQKSSKPVKAAGPFPLKDARTIFPSVNDKKAYLHTGVPDKYISSRDSSAITKLAVYKCNFSRCKREEGEHPEECDVIAQNRGQVSTHIRQQHLNLCIQCYICGHRWWSASEWKKHMEKTHPDLEENDWYVNADIDPGSIVIKTEVTMADVTKDIEDK